MQGRAFKISGTIYDPERGLIRGGVVIENGAVEPVERTLRDGDMEGTVVPTFVNAHTHMGDACIDALPHGMDLAGFVRPPKGYKHVIMAKTSRTIKVRRIKEYLTSAFWNGIIEVHDFREEGVDGLAMGKEAVDATGLPIRVPMYGRPAPPSSPEQVLAACDGFGLSSRDDVGGEVADALARLAHQKGKRFALHASEDGRVEISPVLALKPTFVVHMCHALGEDLEECAKAGVPIAVCPRSNAAFERSPDVGAMLDAGVAVMLGTDNASICTPDMFEEMRYLYLSKHRKISPKGILDMAVLAPRKVFKTGGRFSLWDDALILGRRFDNVESLILKARPEHILAIVTRGRVIRRAGT